MVIGVVGLEQRVEKPGLCLDRTVVCGAVANPLDKARKLSVLGDHKYGSWTHALGFLGADPSAGLS